MAMTAEGIAVVSVVGTLVARSGYLDSSSGLLAYGAIGDAIEAAMADPLVRGVILDVDSPGGEVGGLFDLVARIAALSRPVLASLSGRSPTRMHCRPPTRSSRRQTGIYVTQTGEVGSVGVVAAHVDESGADAQAGLRLDFRIRRAKARSTAMRMNRSRRVPAPRSKPMSTISTPNCAGSLPSTEI